MSKAMDAALARDALAALPEGTSDGEAPMPAQVHFPASHRKAMDPNVMLVTGMRGAGKTFWWAALQNDAVRRLIQMPLTGQGFLTPPSKVATGFGIRPEPDRYPDKDVLKALLSQGREPRTIWRTVLAWQTAPNGHPLRREGTWPGRIGYVEGNPEPIARLFLDIDAECGQAGQFLIVLFDALDRCSDDWRDMYRLIRGLMQLAVDMRSYRWLRLKIFLRTDQADEDRIADFPDASKVLSSSVELRWPGRELYGLLWHCLINGPAGDRFRDFLAQERLPAAEIAGQSLYHVPRTLISDDDAQRRKFHAITGPWMGQNAKRGFPYTWIPNHLGDTRGQVSPRSFLVALREAALDTAERHPEHERALHFESIKRGVQKASRIRVAEIREDYPWMHRALGPLAGMTVPCRFEEIVERWAQEGSLERLIEGAEQDEIKLPPRHVDHGVTGVRQDLESLGVFQRLYDGRVNIPDVFRVGYGLGRKGGVKPVQ